MEKSGLKGTFELSTSVCSLPDLLSMDINPYDAIYLGNAACREYKANLIDNFQDLKEAIEYLTERSKKAYVSLPVAPRTADLPFVEKLIKFCLDNAVHAVEVHNMGVMNLLSEKYSGLPVIIGGFANVYTDVTAIYLGKLGASRIIPNYELTFQEIDRIKEKSKLEIEIQVHGKIPLGISENCLLIERETDLKVKCPEACLENVWLKCNGWSLRNFGKLTLSGKDLCMIEHLPILIQKGYRIFRIEGLSEEAQYRSIVGGIYRKAIEESLKGDYVVDAEALKTLSTLAPNGFCNGFYFGKSGREYIKRADL